MTSRPRARRAALRAAQVASGLVVACAMSACDGSDPPTDAFVEPDAGLDAALVFYDHDAFVDAHFPGDADCRAVIPRDEICCRLGGHEWYVYDGGFAECFVGVPGPFLPPREAHDTIEVG
jgi:hypothetical protein